SKLDKLVNTITLNALEASNTQSFQYQISQPLTSVTSLYNYTKSYIQNCNTSHNNNIELQNLFNKLKELSKSLRYEQAVLKEYRNKIQCDSENEDNNIKKYYKNDKLIKMKVNELIKKGQSIVFVILKTLISKNNGRIS